MLAIPGGMHGMNTEYGGDSRSWTGRFHFRDTCRARCSGIYQGFSTRRKRSGPCEEDL
jgi:hypothetical protein